VVEIAAEVHIKSTFCGQQVCVPVVKIEIYAEPHY